jgi:hypothetical protein
MPAQSVVNPTHGISIQDYSVMIKYQNRCLDLFGYFTFIV